MIFTKIHQKLTKLKKMFVEFGALTTETIKMSLPPTSAAFLLRLIFNPEDGGDMFLLNVGLFRNYAALQLRIP
jgi:hypothetical protein